MSSICNFSPTISEIERIRTCIFNLTGSLRDKNNKLQMLGKKYEQTGRELQQCKKLNKVEMFTDAEKKLSSFDAQLSALYEQGNKIKDDLRRLSIQPSPVERKPVDTPLKSKLNKLYPEIDKALGHVLSNKNLIEAFRSCFGESITQESIDAHIAALEERIVMGRSEIEALEISTSDLNSQLGEKSTQLTKATQVLLTQYNTSAALLSALSIGIVTAGLLFQALTLAVVIPVVVVSLAAIGMWRYKVGTDAGLLNVCHPDRIEGSPAF